ncbi:MAG: ribosomal L7Ae/L30e/S12e/Gadd45 family protein [Lachnospiraceae bacterium]|nr:ribosomal L7Ae/L30e/S12e/Gadd45 family protein [Lachnospiraceae bacterium]
MPTEQQALQLLGLCAKQGAVKSGEFSADKAIKEQKAKLCIVSADASDNTKKGFSDACKFYKVPFRIFSDREKLGKAIGFEFRVSLCVTNEGLANKITEIIDSLQDVPDSCGIGGN